jgi:YfiH family protein
MIKVKLHSKLTLVYTTKEDGNIDPRYSSKDEVKQNRKLIFKELNLKPYEIIEAQQIHDNRLLSINSENGKMWRGHNVTGVDGFTTDQTDIALMLKVADCVPVVIYDPKNHAVGIFHTGWRGAVKQIHVLGLQRMTEVYDTNPKKCLIWLGPSAHNCCFISKDEPKQLSDKTWKPYIKKKKGVWHINLNQYIVDTLKKAGALKKNTIISDVCTVTSKDLYSHVRTLNSDEPEGRFAVIVKLR